MGSDCSRWMIACIARLSPGSRFSLYNPGVELSLEAQMRPSPHLLSELKVVVPPELEKAATAWASEGQTVLYLVVDGRVIDTVTVEDEIRPESAEAVKELHDLGV